MTTETLRDYIGWYGDYDFHAVPFGEVDAVILCAIAYFDLSPAFAELPEPVRLGDCLPLIEQKRFRYTALSVRDMDYAAMLRDAAISRRYGRLQLADCVDILRASPPLQFAAVTFRAEDGFAFIAFRGTDNTLAGWQEDFMISFTHTEAQELALAYARRNIGPGPCRIGGHSKGGNLALYAACRLDEAQWARVERVYLLDGPGLCPEVMDVSCVARVNPRATAVVPTFSVVGKLFSPAIADTRIVKSSAFSILKHSIGSWGVDHGRLALAAENDPASRRLNAVIQQWIDGVPQADRVTFVSELFGALAAGGAVTLDDLVHSRPSALRAVFSRLLAVSRVTKLTAAGLPMRALLGDNYERLSALLFRADSGDKAAPETEAPDPPKPEETA